MLSELDKDEAFAVGIVFVFGAPYRLALWYRVGGLIPSLTERGSFGHGRRRPLMSGTSVALRQGELS